MDIVVGHVFVRVQDERMSAESLEYRARRRRLNGLDDASDDHYLLGNVEAQLRGFFERPDIFVHPRLWRIEGAKLACPQFIGREGDLSEVDRTVTVAIDRQSAEVFVGLQLGGAEQARFPGVYLHIMFFAQLLDDRFVIAAILAE